MTPRTSRFVSTAVALGALLFAAGCGGAKKCDASSCASGCCDSSGVCQVGGTSAACGFAGNLCFACLSGQLCSGGICTAPPGGGGSGGGIGGGGAGGGGTGGGGTGGGGAGGGGAGGGGAGGGGAGGGAGGGGVSGGGGGSLSSWGNAAGVLSGAQLGAGTSANSQVTKPLQVTVSGDPRFQVVSAQLSRETATSENGWVAIRVKNVGTTLDCFVSTDALLYSDASAVTVRDAGAAYVKGTVARVNGTTTTGTCLGPGEEGFMIDIALGSATPNFYSRTTSALLAWSTPGFTSTSVRGRLIPQRYSSSVSTGYTNVTIDFLNDGPVAVTRANALGMLIPLDATGRGLMFGFLSHAGGAETIDAGATDVIGAPSYGFPGSAFATYARVDEFDDCATCLLARPLDLETPEGMERMLRALQEREDAKRRALQP